MEVCGELWVHCARLLDALCSAIIVDVDLEATCIANVAILAPPSVVAVAKPLGTAHGVGGGARPGEAALRSSSRAALRSLASARGLSVAQARGTGIDSKP